MSKFYNTTKERGPVLREYTGKADSQGRLILNYFKHHRYSVFPPSDVSKRFRRKGWPITSVRRTITTLTKERMLVKTDLKKVGPMGRGEYCWKLKTK